MQLRFFCAAVLAVVAVACSDRAAPPAPKTPEVNLYTSRHYDSDLELYERFTQQTGIRVNFIEGKADELVARIKAEGAGSPADVFIAADAGALWRAQQAGLFQPAESATLSERVPAALRDPAGEWFAFTRRARVVAYDAARVQPEEVADLQALAGPRFAGKVCVRSADSVYNLSLVGAMLGEVGPERTEAWVRGLVANFARSPEGGDRDQIRAVAAGVCEVALTNSYYYLRMAHGEDEADRAITQRVKLAFSTLGGNGVHVNISGGGLARHAPNREQGLRLLEFFAAADTQARLAAGNFEFPAAPDATVAPPMDAWLGFTANPQPAAAFAALQPEAQRIMSEAGWR